MTDQPEVKDAEEITDPAELGRHLALENFFCAIDDLSDSARDTLNDLTEDTSQPNVARILTENFPTALEAYRKRMDLLTSTIFAPEIIVAYVKEKESE